MFLTGEILAGLGLGLVLGYALQRGGFCMNSAFRSIAFEKDHSLLRAWLLVVVINVIGVNLLADAGVLNPLTAPLFWPALLAGGVLFGAGMVLAGGCASGTCYRAGRGMLGSWAALVGFVAGTAAMDGGVLSGIQQTFRRPVIAIEGREATLFNVVGAETPAGRWAVIGVLTLAILWWLWRAPKERFLLGWGWRRTGFVVGVLALATWIVSAAFGRNFGLSFTQPTVSLTRWILVGDRSGLNVTSWLVLGVPVGALIAAVLRSEAAWSLPDAPTLVRQGGGGTMMGLGAALAGGCNIGHGITGIATLGIGSIVGVLSIMLGCWGMTAGVYRSVRRASS